MAQEMVGLVKEAVPQPRPDDRTEQHVDQERIQLNQKIQFAARQAVLQPEGLPLLTPGPDTPFAGRGGREMIRRSLSLAGRAPEGAEDSTPQETASAESATGAAEVVAVSGDDEIAG